MPAKNRSATRPTKGAARHEAAQGRATLLADSLERRGRRDLGPLGLNVIELPSRPNSEYTLEELGCAIEQVHGGRLTRAADLTRAAITQWGFLGGVLATITSGILGLPRTLVGGSPEVRAALEGDDDHDSEYDVLFPRSETQNVMAWGYTLGVGLGQFVDPRRATYLPPEPGQPLIGQEQPDGSFMVQPRAPLSQRPVGANRTPSLLAWDPRWLRWQWWDDTWWLTTAAGEIEICPGDGEWLLFTPYKRVRPWEFGAWMALDLAFVMGRDGVFDRGRHAEMLAPVRVGTVPEGTSEPQRREFARQIREMQRFPWFTLPPGLDYKVISVSGNDITAVYKAMVDWAEGDVMVRLTGNKVMVEGSPGFSKGDFQQRVTASMRQSYASDWSDCARNQGISWWSADNYPGHVPARVEYNTDPPEDKDAEIARLGALGDSFGKLESGLDKIGFELADDDGIAALIEKTCGLKARRKPKTAVAVAKIELAPTDIAKVVRVDEARASQGLPPIGNDRDALMISELDAAPGAPQEAAMPQVAS